MGNGFMVHRSVFINNDISFWNHDVSSDKCLAQFFANKSSPKLAYFATPRRGKTVLRMNLQMAIEHSDFPEWHAVWKHGTVKSL